MLFTKTRKKTNESKSTQGGGKSSLVKNSSRAEILKKAYNLFEKRGRQNSQDWDDWFKAEKWCKKTK